MSVRFGVLFGHLTTEAWRQFAKFGAPCSVGFVRRPAHCSSAPAEPALGAPAVQGAEAANQEANNTLNNVRQAMGFVAKPY